MQIEEGKSSIIWNQVLNLISKAISDNGEITGKAALIEKCQMDEPEIERILMDWGGFSLDQMLVYCSKKHFAGLIQTDQLQLFSGPGQSTNPSRYADRLVVTEGKTDSLMDYDEKLWYGMLNTAYGPMNYLFTTHGLCKLEFQAEDSLPEWHSAFPNAEVIVDKDSTRAESILEAMEMRPDNGLKLHLIGSDFQLRVWNAILDLRSNELTTYGRLAKKLNCTGGAQAIGGALNANPLSVIVPCHRIVKEGGDLSGYRWGVDRKLAVIMREGHAIQSMHDKDKSTSKK